MNMHELRESFVRSARRQGEALEVGNSEAANGEYHKLVLLVRRAREMQVTAEALTPFLENDDDHVKYLAATYLLAEASQAKEAETVLERVAERPDLTGFSAKMVLQEWRAGRLHLE